MKKDLFFSPDFRHDFDWAEKYHLRVGSIGPHDKEQISAGLRDMGPESIRNRFLGSKRDFSNKELDYLTQLDGLNHYAIGLEERDRLKRGLAIIRLVRSSTCDTEAEIAITLIDDYQRKGLGPLLLDLIILAALERGIEMLSFTYLPQNIAIEKLVYRAGTPIKGGTNKDYLQLYLDLKALNLSEIKSRLAKSLPVIETFHLKT